MNPTFLRTAISVSMLALSATTAFAQGSSGAAPASAPAAAAAPAVAAAENPASSPGTARSSRAARPPVAKRYNPEAMTMAHKTLPFGTRVKVTNPKNNKSVTVARQRPRPHPGRPCRRRVACRRAQTRHAQAGGDRRRARRRRRRTGQEAVARPNTANRASDPNTHTKPQEDRHERQFALARPASPGRRFLEARRAIPRRITRFDPDRAELAAAGRDRRHRAEGRHATGRLGPDVADQRRQSRCLHAGQHRRALWWWRLRRERPAQGRHRQPGAGVVR